MNGILNFISEIGDVDIDEVAHNIIEHEEAGGFLNWFFGVVSIDEVEDRRKNLVHALDVYCFGVEFCKYEEDSCHMVVVVWFFLLFRVEVCEGLVSGDEFVLLFASGCKKGSDWLLWGLREEGQLSMGSWCIFLDLFPQIVVFLKKWPLLMIFMDGQGNILIDLFIEKLWEEGLVQLLLFLNMFLPFSALFRKITKHYFPHILAN